MDTNETTYLKEDFQRDECQVENEDQYLENEEEFSEVDINETIERAGFGCGTILYCLGPFLLYCLEGGEVIVLSIVGIMLRCEWNLSTFWVAALQVILVLTFMQSYIRRL